MLIEYRKYWKNYVFQSLFATVVTFAAFLFLETENLVIESSLGATAFIVFAIPNNLTAKTRNVIGGHLVGIVCGYTGTLLLYLPFNLALIHAAAYAVTLGLSMFLMVVIDTEHPPAASTALGICISIANGDGFSTRQAMTLILFVTILSMIRKIFKTTLRDLT